MKTEFKVCVVLRDGLRSLTKPVQFSNLLGAVYCKGNLVFTPEGDSLLSPVGNRVSVFNLVQ